MSFTRERLYNGYLRPNMGLIVSTVKVREIVPHLCCLSLSDREEIEAKRETSGNYVAMQHLLSCLRRRESWPEDFIAALEACEHTTMAAEIRREYDSLRGHNNPNPSSPSPPATVVTAHVHPAPPASPLLPPPEGAGQSAAPEPAAAAPEPAAQASLPPEASVQPEASYQATKVASSPEPVPEPPQVAPAPSTPPSSPVTSHHQATTLLLPQGGIHAHQEPEENSETDLQDVSSDEGVIPDEASAGDSVMSGGNSEVTPDPGAPVQQCEAAAPSRPDPAPTAILEVRASQSHTNPETVGSTYTTGTLDKPPVQDTTPPLDKVDAVVLPPKVTENSRQTEATDATSPPPAGADGVDASLCDDDVCLSKPGQLLSIQQDHDSPTLPARVAEEEPYSGGSERLEISSAAAQVPVAAAACRGVSAAPPPPCQENGLFVESLSCNEPEENHYDSLGRSSLGEQEVRVNVVHVAEEPSIQNQDGQSFRPQAQILNGQATKEPAVAAAAADTISNANSGENCHPSPSGPGDFAPELKVRGQQDPEKKTPPSSLSPNAKYILTAAGVGVCAMVMAWRLKN